MSDSPQPTPADALEAAWRKFKLNGTDESRRALGVAIANAVTALRTLRLNDPLIPSLDAAPSLDRLIPESERCRCGTTLLAHRRSSHD